MLPSASVRLLGTRFLSGVKPKFRMKSTTGFKPISRNKRMETRLRERTSASLKRVGPPKSPPEFLGRHTSSKLGSSTMIGASRMTEAGVKLPASAAEYMKGLKPEPG